MLAGKYQTALWSLFWVIGTGIATGFVLREVLGLGAWVGLVGWVAAVALFGRIAYVDWRRDWGS